MKHLNALTYRGQGNRKRIMQKIRQRLTDAGVDITQGYFEYGKSAGGGKTVRWVETPAPDPNANPLPQDLTPAELEESKTVGLAEIVRRRKAQA